MLDTFWFYSRSACGFGAVSQAAQVTGGATFVWTSRALDSTLLILDQMPPAPAAYAGWNPSPITEAEDILAVHHPGAT